jgi:hypothetical protein
MAFSSAPGSFPVEPKNRQLQAYFKWASGNFDYNFPLFTSVVLVIRDEAKTFVDMHLTRPFVGIHLRNNVDWVWLQFKLWPFKYF